MKLHLLILSALLAVVLTGCDGVEGRKQKYMEQAQQSFSEKDYEKARVGYKNVLKIDPKDVPALMGYAETLEKLQEWRGAVARYRAVIELQPENVNARIKLGQLYLLANEVELAENLAAEILAKDSTHPDALTLKAGVLSKKGELSEALQVAENSYGLKPDSIDTIVLLATLRELNARSLKARQLLEAEVKNHPDSIAIHTLLSKFYLADERFDAAEKELQILADLEPENINFKKQLVVFYERTERPDKAESVFKSIIANEDNKTEAIIGLHDLYASRGDLDKAESFLKARVAEHPEDDDLYFRLASFYIRQDKQDIAETMYRDALDKEDVVMVKAKNRLAYLLEKQGKSEEAEQLVTEVLTEHPGNIEALTLRGTMHLKKQDAVSAIADLRTVLNDNPENIEIIKMLGTAHIMNDEPNLAVDMFRALLNLSPKDLPVRLQLAVLYQKLGQKEQAVRQLEMANRVQPNNLQIVERLAQAHMSNNDIENAKSVVENLISLDTTNPRAFHYYALILQAANDHEKAITYFDESLRLKPGAVEPMSGKVRSLIALERLDDALAWLDKVANDLQDNPVAHNLKGEIHLAQKSFADAVTAFEAANTINPSWWLPYRNKALAAVARDDNQAAVDALREGVIKTEGNLKLRAELANISERLKNYDEAIGQYEKIMEKDAGNLLVANNLAMLLVTHDPDNEKALQRAEELSSLLSEQTSPQFQDTVGWVSYARGDYEKALTQIKSAFSAQPDNPEIQYHLGMTYYKINDREKAKQYLTSAVSAEEPFRGLQDARQTLALLQDLQGLQGLKESQK